VGRWKEKNKIVRINRRQVGDEEEDGQEEPKNEDE